MRSKWLIDRLSGCRYKRCNSHETSPSSSDTVELKGRKIKQCWTKHFSKSLETYTGMRFTQLLYVSQWWAGYCSWRIWSYKISWSKCAFYKFLWKRPLKMFIVPELVVSSLSSSFCLCFKSCYNQSNTLHSCWAGVRATKDNRAPHCERKCAQAIQFLRNLKGILN